jgi:hypothetical protein
MEVECGSESLQWLAPHVKENLGNWGREGQEREINKAIALSVGWGNAKDMSSKGSGGQF